VLTIDIIYGVDDGAGVVVDVVGVFVIVLVVFVYV
jgi:hypothetical protein